MRTNPQLGHRSKIALFFGSQSVESDQEEAFIQSSYGLLGCNGHIRWRNGRLLGDIPHMFAPFLQEIGKALGLRNYFLKSVWIYCHPLVLRRFGNGNSSILIGKGLI